MTWEEIDRKYEKEKNYVPLLERDPKFEKNWATLLRSTEKLLWLFTVSSGRKPVKHS